MEKSEARRAELRIHMCPIKNIAKLQVNGKSEARRAALHIHVNGKRETYVAYAMRQTLAGIWPHFKRETYVATCLCYAPNIGWDLTPFWPSLPEKFSANPLLEASRWWWWWWWRPSLPEKFSANSLLEASRWRCLCYAPNIGWDFTPFCYILLYAPNVGWDLTPFRIRWSCSCLRFK